MASELKTKALSGVIWSFVQRFGTMAISFVSNIVLARLLTPDDYGVIGMLMIFIAVSNTFIDGGFGSALIQKKEPTQADYSTIFWWNMFLSLVIYGLLFLGAPAIAKFYNLPLLTDVLRVQGFVLILNALSIIQQNQLRKQLKFKRLATVTVISATLSASIAIALAYMGWGVWALVAQQLMLSGFNAIQLWVLNKWYPLLAFSKESFKQLFGFGGFILASNLINTVFNKLQVLIIGKLFNPSTLGYYTQAVKLEDVISHSISSVVEQVSYPILSEVQNDNNSLKNMLYKFSSMIAFATTPLMFILIISAKAIIVTLYTEKWLPSAEYFQILCFAGIAICLQGISYYAVASKGRSKEIFKWTLIKRTLGGALIIISTIIWGMNGLLWGYCAAAWLLLLVNQYLVSRYIGYTLFQQYKDLLPIFILSFIVFAITVTTINLIDVNIYFKGIIGSIIYFTIYIGSAYLFNIKAFIFLINNIREFIHKK